MKNLLTTAAVATTLVLGATTANAKAFEVAGVRIGNPFDSKTWWEGSDGNTDEPVVINFADPDFWMNFPDPSRHSVVHTALSDPATWAQMMKPETYINMMDMDIWLKWADLSTYDVFLDPATYTYWAQPGAYGHLMDIEFYTERFNPLAYGEMMDAALGNIGLELSDVADALHLSGLLGSAADETAEAVIEN